MKNAGERELKKATRGCYGAGFNVDFNVDYTVPTLPLAKPSAVHNGTQFRGGQHKPPNLSPSAVKSASPARTALSHRARGAAKLGCT